MDYSLRAELDKRERFAGGHRMCAGCGAPVAVRAVLRALNPGDHAAIVSATGCLQAATFPYPYAAWEDSWLHSAFENAGAGIGGVEAAYQALKRRGKVTESYKLLAFGGDGGTYDIGLQSLSGALERGHDITYICYDNEAYMNTGIQRSSSTSRFADTTTSPAGSRAPGKPQNKKDLTDIIVAHALPYVAQTTFLGDLRDLHQKARKAVYTEGPTFLNILAPCPRGWRYNASALAEITRLAADTCVWPLFEVEEGVWRITYMPKKKRPIEDYLRPQGRFHHLFTPENRWMIGELQAEVDRKWDALLEKVK